MASVRPDVRVPESPVAPRPMSLAPAPARRRVVAGWPHLVAAALLLVGGVAIVKFHVLSLFPVMLAAGTAAVMVSLIGVVRGIFTLLAARREHAGAPEASTRWTWALLAGNLAMTHLGAIGAQAWRINEVDIIGRRGRQLRRRGKVLLPPVTTGGTWASPDLAPSVDPALRAALAAQWRQNGRTEHASIAAFARLTLDLMSLGAPPELVASASRDALDEIRHAELCFALARALDGRLESPGPFPEVAGSRRLPSSRPRALALLAADSLVDGALYEGVSARMAARLARCSEDPVIRGVLREIAADEGRHAAHGWDVVEWCLAEGGEPVAHALRRALSTLPRSLRTQLPAAARLGGWERHGIHGHELEAQEYAKARAHLTARVNAMTRGSRPAAA